MIDKQFDRFDFEQQIMSCWSITDDLKDLRDGIEGHEVDLDRAGRILYGIEQLYELRFSRLFDQFEQMVAQMVVQKRAKK
jgi:hypothetical protein